MINIGDQIRDLRKARGLNQDQLAEMASLNRVTVAKYESGKVEPGAHALSRIADALEARGIDLYLYWTGDGPTKDPQAFAGLQGAMPVTKEYMKNWSDVVAEYGERYGTKVKGWWIDGSYSWIGHSDETFAILAKGLRAGNPDRILAFNPGVDPKVMAYTDFDDFTAATVSSLHLARSPIASRSGSGTQTLDIDDSGLSSSDRIRAASRLSFFRFRPSSDRTMLVTAITSQAAPSALSSRQRWNPVQPDS